MVLSSLSAVNCYQSIAAMRLWTLIFKRQFPCFTTPSILRSANILGKIRRGTEAVAIVYGFFLLPAVVFHGIRCFNSLPRLFLGDRLTFPFLWWLRGEDRVFCACGAKFQTALWFFRRTYGKRKAKSPKSRAALYR
jgi:hypothetical protein